MTNQELASWAAGLLRSESKHLKERAVDMPIEHEGAEVDQLCFAQDCEAAADELEGV